MALNGGWAGETNAAQIGFYLVLKYVQLQEYSQTLKSLSTVAKNEKFFKTSLFQDMNVPSIYLIPQTRSAADAEALLKPHILDNLYRHASICETPTISIASIGVGGRVFYIAGGPPNMCIVVCIWYIRYLYSIYGWLIEYIHDIRCLYSIYGWLPAKTKSQKWRPPTTMIARVEGNDWSRSRVAAVWLMKTT